MKSILRVLVIFLGAGFAVTAHAASIEHFFVAQVINQNGQIMVDEEVTISELTDEIFERTFPRTISGSDGREYKVTISDIAVTDFNDHPVTFELQQANNWLTLQIPADGRPDQFFSIRYTVTGALIENEDGIEMYWPVTGPKHTMSIVEASIKVNLPTPVAEYSSVEATCYVDNQLCDEHLQGYDANGDIQAIGFQHNSGVRPDQTLRFELRLPKHIVTVDSATTVNSGATTRTAAFVFLIVGVAGIIVWRRVHT